jgi:hypothetical protein
MAKRHIANARYNQSLARRQGQIEPRAVSLVVCGGQTERYYFEALRERFKLRTTEVIIPSGADGADPMKQVEYAEGKCREKGGYDSVYCVFDRDQHPSFEPARAKIRALAQAARKPLPIHEAISIPAFEVWVLAHFERTTSPFANCDAVIQRIRDEDHIRDYTKANVQLSQRLVERVDKAIDNGLWLEERAREDAFDNPFTNVHALAKFLKEVGDS